MARLLNHVSAGVLAMAFLVGAIVMMIFVVLSGFGGTTPLDRIYFLRADTSGITGARDITQWTFFRMCGDDNEDCGSSHAGLPFGYAWDSNPRNAPEALVGDRAGNTTSDFYFFTWRFGWVLYLISVFFTSCAFLSGVLSCIGRLGARLAGLACLVALVFYSVAVALMTAAFVKARNEFVNDNRDAEIGKYAFAFAWGAFGAICTATVLFCLGARGHKKRGDSAPGRQGGFLSTFRSGGGGVRSETPARQVKNEYH